MVYLHLGSTISGEVRTLGPFEFVQITYNYLVRVNDDQEIMYQVGGMWQLQEDMSIWTDLTISGEA